MYNDNIIVPVGNTYNVKTSLPEEKQNNIIPKKYFETNKKDIMYAAIAVILGFFVVSLTLWGGFKCGFTISYMLFYSYVTTYCITKNTKLNYYSFICGCLGVALSLIFTFSKNSTVNTFTFMTMIMLSSIWFDSINGTRKEKGELGIIFNNINSIFINVFGNIGISLRSIFSKANHKNGTTKKVVVGVALALPVLFIIVPLLASSDVAFKGLISNSFGKVGDFPFKIIIGLVFAMFTISYCFGLKKRERPEGTTREFKGCESIYVVSFLSVLSLIYLLYMISQLAYFFSAFRGILPDGYKFSVAEYARTGFFEMALIAGINFCLVFGSLIISRKKNNKPSKGVKLLCVFVSIFTLLLISTAFSKMILYIKSFGMTELRILTSSFMAFLEIVFIALIIRCFSQKIKVVKTGIIAGSIILLILGLGDVNKRIAEYNVSSYLTGKLDVIDVYNLQSLGTSGVPSIVKLATSGNKDTKTNARQVIYEIANSNYKIDDSYNGVIFYKQKDDNMGSWNLSSTEALKYINNYMKNTNNKQATE